MARRLLTIVGSLITGLVLFAAGSLGEARTFWQANASLREKAKRTGKHVVNVYPDPIRRFNDLEPLIYESEAIIVGQVDRQHSVLSSDEELITTDYQISVKEVLKGDNRQGQQVILNLIGGTVRFDNGSYAQVIPPIYWKSPEVGRIYVYFLVKRGPSKFGLLGGPQGLFKLTEQGIEPQGLPTDRLLKTYRNKDVDGFIKTIRAVLDRR